MSEKANSKRGVTRLLFILLPLVLLYGAYEVVLHFVREHVNEQIHKNVQEPMPDFEMLDLAGKKWTKQSLLGKRVVVSHFRSRCAQCKGEKDALHKMAAAAKEGGYQVVSIMMDGVLDYPEELTKKTLNELGYRHPVLMANKAYVDALHGSKWAHVTPVTYVVDAKGVIQTALRGQQSLESLRRAVQ